MRDHTIYPCIVRIGWRDMTEFDREVYLYGGDKRYFYGEDSNGVSTDFPKDKFEIKGYVYHDHMR